MPLRELLQSLMVGPVRRQASPSGVSVEVYPLALPEGEGLSIPLGQFGELGFRNRQSLLVLTVPKLASPWIQAKLGSALVKGPVEQVGLDGATVVVEFYVRLRPGMRAAIPLGLFGEIGVEAG